MATTFRSPFGRSRIARAVATFVVLVIAAVAIFKYRSIQSNRQLASKRTPAESSTPNHPTVLSAFPSKSGGEAVKASVTIPPAAPPSTGTPSTGTPSTGTPPPAPPLVKIPTDASTLPPAAPPAKLEQPTNIPLSSDLFESATKRTTSGDLIGARKVLNDALVGGSLSPADADAAMKQIASINQTLVFSDRRFKDDPHGGLYTVAHGDNLTKIARIYSVPVELLKQINNFKSDRDLKADQPIKVVKGPICAVVSKGKFSLDLYLGAPGGSESVYLTSFQVGLGSENSTPTGTWSIASRTWHPRYDSPPGRPPQHFLGGDPKSPIGPCWIALEGTDGQAVGKQSYGIHGTVDPDSIGKMASEGCIRLRNDDAEKVYDMLVPHKSVVIVKD